MKKAVDDRYQMLAANNVAHFVEPGGAHQHDGAGNTYRESHEAAIQQAFNFARMGSKSELPLANEAMAQHFLQDAFASGHLRTPRSSIQQHWAAIYPAFWDNLRKKIAHDVAVFMNDDDTNLATIGGTVQAIYTTVLAEVMTKTAELPAIGFGDLMSEVAHDEENKVGLKVMNGHGDRWTTYGDSNMKRGRTQEMVESAVAEGVRDIDFAYQLGVSGAGGRSAASLAYASVRKLVRERAGNDQLYGPEMYLPRIDPDAEDSTLNWKASSYDDLLDMKIRSDGEDHATYADRIAAAVTEEGEDIRTALEEMADKFDDTEEVYKKGVYLGTLHPKRGYQKGFLEPLKCAPVQGLREIIHFDPNQNQAWFNEDDAAREDVEGKSTDELAQLTLQQRADRIKALIEGWTNFVGDDDGDLVLKIFESTDQGQRADLYELIEGHEWEGKFIEGWFTSDDELWNALSRDRLRKLRTMINDG